jgi:hypothetical protein
MTLLDIDPPLAALNRLVTIAQSDTGQARRVTNFLLAWWRTGVPGSSTFRGRILPERRRHGRPALPASRAPVREMPAHG